LGSLSAARIYGLDFIPVANEQYNLLIAQAALELEAVRRLMAGLNGDEFARRLNNLGGYTLKNPGEIRQWN
jgi:putative molybdopterin biosynthesis protein